MDLTRVEVVLVRPARAGNVAGACRAMKNMGLRRLWLVEPPAALLEHEARALAYGAWDVLDGASRAGSLAEAVAASTTVVGTTGRDVPGAWSPRRLAAAARQAGDHPLSVVFGPEASGLTAREMDLCHHLVHVPTDPDHPSLNLAQAVLLVGYELRLAALEAWAAGSGVGSDVDATEPAASAGELEAAVQDLRAALLAIGYLDPACPDRVLTELRRLLARARPTPREITLLRGVARQAGWAGRNVAKGGSGSR